MHAVDDDIGANGAVRYRLKQDPLGHWRTFDIDHVTGSIALKESLDRERQKIYEVNLNNQIILKKYWYQNIYY